MKFVFRGVAQLGLERMVRDHEAGGSNPLAPTRMGSPVTSEDLKGHFRRPNREEQRPFIGSFQGKKRLIQEGDLIGVLFSAQRTIHDTA